MIFDYLEIYLHVRAVKTQHLFTELIPQHTHKLHQNECKKRINIICSPFGLDLSVENV